MADKARERTSFKVECHKVRKIIKHDLKLSFRKVRRLPWHANSERALVLRQRYALQMIELLKKGKRIINLDESWLSDQKYSNRMWCSTTGPATVPDKGIS